MAKKYLCLPISLATGRSLVFLLGIFAFGHAVGHTQVIKLLGGGAIEVTLPPSSSERFAVDASYDLLSWTELTNVLKSHDQIVFQDPERDSLSVRFYRLSDADETFLIGGSVAPLAGVSPQVYPQPWQGPPFCADCYYPPDPTSPRQIGLWANATVTMQPGGYSTVSDLNGHFQFNQRFSRSMLPIELHTSMESFISATNSINTTNANLPIQAAPLFLSGQFPFEWDYSHWGEAPALARYPIFRYRFDVETGLDRGVEIEVLSERPSNGGPSEAGAFLFSLGAGKVISTVKLASNPSRTNLIRFWPSASNPGRGIFSLQLEGGRTNAGRFSADLAKTFPSPPGLQTLAIQFYNPIDASTNLTLSFTERLPTVPWTKEGTFLTTSLPHRSGTFVYYPTYIPAYLSLTYADEGTPTEHSFTLYFHGDSGSTNINEFVYWDGVRSLSAAGTFRFSQ